MTTQRKVEIVAAIALFILCVTFAVVWVQEREARIRAEVTAQADEKISAAAASAIATRDEQTKQYVAAIQTQQAAIQTPQQAAQVILHYLPTPVAAPGQVAPAPAPIATVNRAQLSPELQAQLPDAPTFTLLTPDQAKEIAKQDLACDATQHTLTSCQQDTTDLKTQIAAKTDEAKVWEQAAKGGTKLQRLGKILKSIACAGAGAGLGALADKGNPTAGAAIGGGAAVAGCSVF